MKVLLSDNPPRWLDLDAPTVAAHTVSVGGCTHWRITCPYCGDVHLHGPGEGHRFAHCITASPAANGYNLAYARRPFAELLAEIETTPEADRGPLLDELDWHEHDAGEEMFGQE